jgi:hypothetical protein
MKRADKVKVGERVVIEWQPWAEDVEAGAPKVVQQVLKVDEIKVHEYWYGKVIELCGNDIQPNPDRLDGLGANYAPDAMLQVVD